MSADTKEPEVPTETTLPDVRGIAAGLAAVETTEQPTAYTKAEQSHYQQILKHGRVVDQLKLAMERSKSAATMAKKVYEDAVDEANTLRLKGPDLQQRLPGMDDGSKEEAWRELPISELLLKNAIGKALIEASLNTLGVLSGYIAQYGEQWWRGLPGIGAGKATEVADAFVAFWKAHPEFCSTDSEPDDGDDDDDDENEDD